MQSDDANPSFYIMTILYRDVKIKEYLKKGENE